MTIILKHKKGVTPIRFPDALLVDFGVPVWVIWSQLELDKRLKSCPAEKQGGPFHEN